MENSSLKMENGDKNFQKIIIRVTNNIDEKSLFLCFLNELN